MAEPKFTAGPWFVSEDERDGMEWNRHISTDPDGENRICFMAHGGIERDDEFCANARLLAAAPDLYAALAAVSDMLFARPDMVAKLRPLMGLAEHAIFDATAAALAKARGE